MASITKITPTAVEKHFRLGGLGYPDGLAFNNAGNLFVSNGNGVDTITEITPGGAQTTFASGLNAPIGMAFNSAGNLFVADAGANHDNGDITEITPGGVPTVFSTSVSKPLSIAFQGLALPVPEPSTFALLGIGATALLMRRRIFPAKS